MQNLALLGVVAAMALVVVSAFVKTMISLRWLPVASSVGFLIYGALHPSIPMLVLNAGRLQTGESRRHASAND